MPLDNPKQISIGQAINTAHRIEVYFFSDENRETIKDMATLSATVLIQNPSGSGAMSEQTVEYDVAWDSAAERALGHGYITLGAASHTDTGDATAVSKVGGIQKWPRYTVTFVDEENEDPTPTPTATPTPTPTPT